jgi:murein L,D-transpeptidase YafK
MKKYLLFLIIPVILYIVWYIRTPYDTKPVSDDIRIDQIVVEKSNNELKVYSKGKYIKSYRVSFGFKPIGHKQFEGDGKTPEGIYTINDKNPNSGFHLNLGISYPNEQDTEFARLQNKSPGGDIKIHGLKNRFGWVGNLHRLGNWTNGCIAVNNSEMEELYDHVEIGATIEIKP